MNWEINKITLTEKNFKSPPLKIKSIRKMERSEWEREKAPREDWGDHLQAYWVEVEGKINFPISDTNNENKIRVLGRSYKEIDANWIASSNKEIDIFYYFVNNLGKELRIPFRNIAYNNPRDINNRKLFFRLSDSEVDSENSDNKGEINNIIKEVKQEWDKFGYEKPEDLVQENKVWVDKKVYKKYKTAFQTTDLINSPEGVKNWQDTEDKTGLDAYQAMNAYKSGWLPDEISKKNGSLDNGKSYPYDSVLTLQKSKLQEAEQKLIEKIREVTSVSREDRKKLLTELEEIRNSWSSSDASAEQKAILEVNKGQLDNSIQELRSEKENEKIQEIIVNDPQTGKGWDPSLTDKEKSIINDPTLNTLEVKQETALLLSYLRNIYSDNGGSGNLADWNNDEAVSEAIKVFQLAHYNNLLTYQRENESSDKGKAWKAVNYVMNDVAENVYQRYWKLLENILSQVNKQEGLISDLQKQISDEQKQNEELQEKNTQLKKDLAEAQKDNSQDKEAEITALKKRIEELEGEIKLKDKATIIFKKNKDFEINELKKDISDLRDELAKLQGKSQTAENIGEIIRQAKSAINVEELKKAVQSLDSCLQSEQFKELEEGKKKEIQELRDLLAAKSQVINDLEGLMKDKSGAQLPVTDDELIRELKKDISLTSLIDWRNLIIGTADKNSLAAFKTKLEEAIRTVRNREKDVTPLDTAKTAAISDIKKSLEENSLEEKDIISDYQGYAEKIKEIADQQSVEDFAREVVAYLKACGELKGFLDKAEKVSQDSYQGKGNKFEEIRQVRQDLDDFSERGSREAQLAFLTMNKDNRVIDHKKKLANYLKSHILNYEELVNDSSNAKFLEGLNSRGYVKGTKEYDLYWKLQRIIREFAKTRLNGIPVNFYPYVTAENVGGQASLVFKGEKPAHFELRVNFADSKDEFERKIEDKSKRIPSSFCHEASHLLTKLGEHLTDFEGEKVYGHQSHSWIFWKFFRYRSNSTLNYVSSCLSPEERQELKTYVLSPLVINGNQNRQNQNRFIYFPKIDHEIFQTGKEKKKMLLNDEQVVRKEWDFTWQKVLQIVDDSMNKDPNNWEAPNDSEAKKRSVVVEIIQPWETETGHYKIHVFYNENTMPKEDREQIDSIFSRRDGWVEKPISPRKAQKIYEKADNFCEKDEEIQQEAQIVVREQPLFPSGKK